jgi:hypothetical protein
LSAVEQRFGACSRTPHLLSTRRWGVSSRSTRGFVGRHGAELPPFPALSLSRGSRRILPSSMPACCTPRDDFGRPNGRRAHLSESYCHLPVCKPTRTWYVRTRPRIGDGVAPCACTQQGIDIETQLPRQSRSKQNRAADASPSARPAALDRSCIGTRLPQGAYANTHPHAVSRVLRQSQPPLAHSADIPLEAACACPCAPSAPCEQTCARPRVRACHGRSAGWRQRDVKCVPPARARRAGET